MVADSVQGYCSVHSAAVTLSPQFPHTTSSLWLCSMCGVLETLEDQNHHIWSPPDWLIKQLTEKTTRNEILSLEFQTYDLDYETVTIEKYLKTLLETLWKEGENFSSKRPLGNSDWQWNVCKPLIESGFVEGEIDEFGDVQDVDWEAVNKLIIEAIRSL
jgi:hypothetical protein